MGAEIEGWSASIQLGAAASGGYSFGQALAMLADHAKKFVRGTITVADLPDDERGLYAQAPAERYPGYEADHDEPGAWLFAKVDGSE